MTSLKHFLVTVLGGYGVAPDKSWDLLSNLVAKLAPRSQAGPLCPPGMCPLKRWAQG